VTEPNELKDLTAALAEPFPAESLGCKPQTISGNRALAVYYIDARDVMDRLDAVVGPANWQDEYHNLPDGNVVCRLSLRVGGEWIAKTDVGGESEQKDPGDRAKAAFSDALKRAAVKWSIGRYLYSLPAVWCDYDPQRKQLLRMPPLPAWALPRGAAAPAPKPPPAPKPAPKPAPTPAPEPGPAPPPRPAPTPAQDAAAMKAGVEAYDRRLADEGVISKGGLINHLLIWGQRECGWGPDMGAWPASAIPLVREETKRFEARARQFDETKGRASA
jgi:hypothetical protein